MAAPVGLEPTTHALTARRSAIELWGNVPVPQVRIELTTFCSSPIGDATRTDRRYYQLSYRGIRRERRDLNPHSSGS
jgi:hypothetical protein